MLIDTHCHLNFKTFKKNLDEVLWQAKEAGVEKIIVPGADLDSSKRAVELARTFKSIYAAVGIHPHYCQREISRVEIKEKLRNLAKNNKVVAIGECGLDYQSSEKIDKKLQKEFFEAQLELAKEFNLPVIFHCRESQKDIKKILQKTKFKKLKGVFHCFSGNKDFLKWVLERGFYVGFDGNLTYNFELQKMVKLVPLSRILLETDAPFLTPEPLRSQKIFPNKPENVKIIANQIASLKTIPFLKVSEQSSKNSLKLFHFN